MTNPSDPITEATDLNGYPIHVGDYVRLPRKFAGTRYHEVRAITSPTGNHFGCVKWLDLGPGLGARADDVPVMPEGWAEEAERTPEPSGGVQRGQMVLDGYSREDQALSNLLADLAEYAAHKGLDWAMVTTIAGQRAKARGASFPEPDEDYAEEAYNEALIHGGDL